MAYTKTPENATYKTERFAFVGNPQQRDGITRTKDQRFVNIFAEQIKSTIGNGKQYYVRQRPGLAFNQAAPTTGIGRGIVAFNGSVLYAVGDVLYKDGIAFLTLSTSTGTVGFTEYNGTYDALIVLDGVSGWVIQTDWTTTQIISPDFPTPHIPCPVYMDGFLFVVKSGTADLYNCVLEDPLSWTAGDFFTAELYPDAVVSAVKINNYIVVIGTDTIEYMYNGAVPTGSPLARNETAVQQFGTCAPNSVAQSESSVFMVGNTGSGGRTIWALEGFKATDIGLEFVREVLDNEGSSIENATGFIVRTAGHRFYVVNLTNRTLVYDIEEKMWSEWSSTADLTGFPCKYACNSTIGQPYFLHESTGRVFLFNPSTALDDGVPMYAAITTVKLDFDSMNRKFCYRFSLIGDVPHGDATPISVQWSDDDYVTWSSARTLTLNGDLPSINQLGLFRRRAFKLTYSSSYPLRLEAFELDINLGQT